MERSPPTYPKQYLASVTVETGHVPIPSQIHQLASLLHNILQSDREYNAPILEKLETPPADPNANPIQLFTASDLAHLAIAIYPSPRRLLPNMLAMLNWMTSRRSLTRWKSSWTSTPEWGVVISSCHCFFDFKIRYQSTVSELIHFTGLLIAKQ